MRGKSAAAFENVCSRLVRLSQIETRLARRFFLQKHGLRRVYEHVQRRGHREVYMRDMLRLNSATNDKELLSEEGASGEGRDGDASVAGSSADSRVAKKAAVFAIALEGGNDEVKKLSAQREAVLQGVRSGFAAVVDALEPFPEKRGRGKAEALRVRLFFDQPIRAYHRRGRQGSPCQWK